MSLPVYSKPEVNMDYEKNVVTYPNALDPVTMDRLRDYAVASPKSGIHRRTSKSPDAIRASFTTCLVYHTSDEIYQILSPLWDRYIQDTRPNITFIEPYELKIYYEGDRFGYHHDSYGSMSLDIDRKVNLTIQLSDENDYTGGNLFVGNHRCPRTRGTAIFFPSHYHHYVTKVVSGSRCVLIGHAWGPFVK
jgi:hypothetical protein